MKKHNKTAHYRLRNLARAAAWTGGSIIHRELEVSLGKLHFEPMDTGHQSFC
ncbi:MAG: hypothetical protein ACKO3V_13205 [Pirellula sp.]